jgi:phosphoglycerol transferase MdoB-like AlkP superfamily enzyme
MLSRLKKILPPPLLFLTMVAMLLIAIFLVSRVGMVFYNASSYQISSYFRLFEAFILGIWFDIIVSAWLLFIPFLVLTYNHYKNINNEKINRAIRIYCTLIIIIALLAVGIDMPYYKFFNSRLNVAAVPRIQNLFFALSFLSKEPQYYPFAIVFLLLAWGLSKLILFFWRTSHQADTIVFTNRKRNVSFASIGLGLSAMLFLRPSEETMKAAYFTNDPFVNQVVLNPVFTYADSYYNDFDIEKKMLDSTALSYMQASLKVRKQGLYPSPIAKKIGASNGSKPNVVIILMESMSAERMGWFYKADTTLTPFLDKLTKKSLFFPQFYSWGIHTYNGIFSSLYGMPYNMLEHPMKKDEFSDQYYGIAGILKDNGYRTTFICTHDKEFDNIGSFIPKNGFQELYDIKTFPKEKHVNDWGVGDETLYEQSLVYFDSIAKRKEPFFTTLLSISNHPPFTFPSFTTFKGTAADARDRGFQYADWALEAFFKAAEKKPWFENTIFVLIGDHGVNTPSPWEATLTYNHVPCYFYAPKLISPSQNNKLGSQLDILPTLMHLAKIPYVQNTVGYNLITEKRPFVVFSQDHKLCVVSKDKILIQRKGGTTSLYHFNDKQRDTINLIQERKALADSMQTYAAAMLKVTKKMVSQNLFQKQMLLKPNKK